MCKRLFQCLCLATLAVAGSAANCTACVDRGGAFCPNNGACWTTVSDCNGACGLTECYRRPSECPVSGELPQFNGDCIACVGQGYFCAHSGDCWTGASMCRAACNGTDCAAFSFQCPGGSRKRRVG